MSNDYFHQKWNDIYKIQNSFSLPINTKKSSKSSDTQTLQQMLNYKDEFMLESQETAQRLGEFMKAFSEFIDFEYRYKEDLSIEEKWNKQKISRPLNKIFNDILGFRIIIKGNTEELSKMVEEFICCNPIEDLLIKEVDFIASSKSTDDGYQGIHVYVRLDNHHFPLEIQFWTRAHALLNNYLHENIYKSQVDSTKLNDYAIDLRVWLEKVPVIPSDFGVTSNVDYIYEKIFDFDREAIS